MKLTNEDAIGWLNGIKADGFGDNGEEEKETAIDMAIKALREQRERGKWETLLGQAHCSKCGHANLAKTNYCPKCGADMVIRCPKCGNRLEDVTNNPKRAKWTKDYVCLNCFDVGEKVVSYSKGEVE